MGRRRRRRRSVVPPFPPMEGRWRFRPPRMETRGGIRQRLNGLFRVSQHRRTHILGDICCTKNAIVKVWRMSPTTFGGNKSGRSLSFDSAWASVHEESMLFAPAPPTVVLCMRAHARETAEISTGEEENKKRRHRDCAAAVIQCGAGEKRLPAPTHHLTVNKERARPFAL